MPKFTNAKINDKVWSSIDGYGEIKEINKVSNPNFPIKVLFNNGICKSFTKNGEESMASVYPTLFWNEFHIPKDNEDIKPFNLVRFLKENLEPKKFEYDTNNITLYFTHSLINYWRWSGSTTTEDIGVVYFRKNDKLDNIVDTLNHHKITPQQLRDAYKELGWL